MWSSVSGELKKNFLESDTRFNDRSDIDSIPKPAARSWTHGIRQWSRRTTKSCCQLGRMAHQSRANGQRDANVQQSDVVWPLTFAGGFPDMVEGARSNEGLVVLLSRLLAEARFRTPSPMCWSVCDVRLLEHVNCSPQYLQHVNNYSLLAQMCYVEC